MTLVTAAMAPFGPMRSAHVCAALAIGSKGSAGAVEEAVMTPTVASLASGIAGPGHRAAGDREDPTGPTVGRPTVGYPRWYRRQ
ncbi:hypothetical protein GCM10011594_07820 [Nakamurella endophytica]|uniref:Uncharacterized protein n=1 Tax=Nakamurella endophytica TaxID=1748367 RepID=A0A917SNG8_9ACTN|nr:hypothetical protein GCM10011594_07820 [Nakamurella endophytica]